MYIGRTSQRLEEQIRQHIPKFIRNQVKFQKDFPRRQFKSSQNASVSDSVIGQHLLDNKICAEKLDINWFLILAVGRLSFHLAKLKATFIESLERSSLIRRNTDWSKS